MITLDRLLYQSTSTSGVNASSKLGDEDEGAVWEGYSRVRPLPTEEESGRGNFLFCDLKMAILVKKLILWQILDLRAKQ